MTYSKDYYAQRKQEIQIEYQQLVIDTYNEIERLCIKKSQKTTELQEKIKVLEDKEKESMTAPENIEPAKIAEPAESKK